MRVQGFLTEYLGSRVRGFPGFQGLEGLRV